MKRILIIALLAFAAMPCAWAQLSTSETENYEPLIIPPSPNVYAFSKYDQIKIDEFTGMISESIPLYTFMEGGISVPISLSYRSGGFRVKERAGRVGLGWSLSAGGVVSRTVVGGPDNKLPGSTASNGFLSLADSTTYQHLISTADDQAKYHNLYLMAHGCYDGQPDIFSFNVNGLSGQFNFDWDGNLLVSSAQKVDISIKWANGYNSGINGWTIIGPDGTVYEFDAIEQTRTISTTGVNSCFFEPQQVYNSAWMLTEIKQAGSNRSVFFEYDTYKITDFETNNSVSRTHKITPDSQCSGTTAGTNNTSKITLDYDGQKLKRIYGSHTPVEVKFNDGIARTDITGIDIYALGSVKIFNGTIEVKEFDLDHDHSTGRLTLKSVLEKSTTTQAEPFTFEYYGTLTLPTSNKKDAWGFENNNSSSDEFAQYEVVFQGFKQTFGSADRSPSYDGSVSGMLKKIYYPVGGYTEYQYELNDYAFVNGPGVFDYEITNVTAFGQSNGEDNNTCGTATGYTINDTPFTINQKTCDPNDLNCGNPANELINVQVVPNINGGSFGAGFAPKVEVLDGSTVLATYLEAVSGQTFTLNLAPGTYTIRTYARWKDCDGTYDMASASASYDNYTGNVTTEKATGGVRVSKVEKRGSTGDLLLSKNYDYELEDGRSSGFIYDEPSYVYYTTKVYDGTLQSGSSNIPAYSCECAIALTTNRHSTELTKGSHVGYKRVTITEADGANGKQVLSFEIVPDDIATSPPFQSTSTHAFRSGLLEKVEHFVQGSTTPLRVLEYDYTAVTKSTNGLKVDYLGHLGPTYRQYNFVLGNYLLNAGHVQQTQVVDKTFEPGGSIEKTTTYTFDGELQFLERETMEEINSKKYVKEYFYPKDFASPIQSIQYLKDNHIHRPIEIVNSVEESSNQSITGSTYLLYDNEFLDKVYRTDIDIPITASSFNYAKDNTGNRDSHYQSDPDVELHYEAVTGLLLGRSSNGITKSYLRDDDGYPIAEVVNAEVDQIFHSSFEDNLNTAGLSKTGSRYRNQGSFDFQAHGGFSPPPGIEMAMSYWYWHNDEWKYSGELSFSNQISSPGTRMDEVRAYPKGAMMTTYITNPVFGIEFNTDVNGNTAQYKYDGLGRLIMILDNEGHVLKQFKYSYSNQ